MFTAFKAASASLAAIAALTFLSPVQANAAEFTFRLSHHMPTTQPTHKGFVLLMNEVKKELGDRVQTKLYPGATLFGAGEAVSSVESGVVEASNMVSSFQVGLIPDIGAIELPFLFDDHNHFRRVLNAGLFDRINALYEKHGVKLLNYYPKGFQQLFHRSKFLLTPADFKGEDLRGVGGYQTLALELLGASPVSIPSPAEVQTALQRGVIDGLINNYNSHVSRGYWEFTKYVSYMNLMEAGEGVGVSLAWWNKLPADVQAAFQRAADKMNDFMWELNIRTDEQDCIAGWAKKGCKVQKATAEQLVELRRILAPLYDKARQEMPLTAELFTLIEQTRAQ